MPCLICKMTSLCPRLGSLHADLTPPSILTRAATAARMPRIGLCQVLAATLTLSQPGGADYAHYITTGTTGSADLHTALMLIVLNHWLWIMFPLFLFKLHKHFKGNKGNFEEFYGCRLYVAWRASLMVSEKSLYKCP